jgi:hypothetical protein
MMISHYDDIPLKPNVIHEMVLYVWGNTETMVYSKDAPSTATTASFDRMQVLFARFAASTLSGLSKSSVFAETVSKCPEFALALFRQLEDREPFHFNDLSPPTNKRRRSRGY